jgi:hypothetical protein
MDTHRNGFRKDGFETVGGDSPDPPESGFEQTKSMRFCSDIKPIHDLLDKYYFLHKVFVKNIDKTGDSI